jgi:soluble lytic murein transglycosylase-like protein
MQRLSLRLSSAARKADFARGKAFEVDKINTILTRSQVATTDNEAMNDATVAAAESAIDNTRYLGPLDKKVAKQQVRDGVLTVELTQKHERDPDAMRGELGARNPRRARTIDLITSMSKAAGVDPNTMLALSQFESGINHQAVSPAGAFGLVQMMPATAARYGITPSSTPEQQIAGGIAYLKDSITAIQKVKGKGYKPTTCCACPTALPSRKLWTLCTATSPSAGPPSCGRTRLSMVK